MTGMTAAQEWRQHWPTVLAAAFGMSCAVLYLYSAGAFVVPIEEDTGWSRAQIGSGITIVTVITAFVSPLAGAAIDRYGARRMALIAITLQPTTFAAIGLTGTDIQQWWFHWALLGIAGFAMCPAVWTAAVASLFDRSRGLALAVTMSGMGVGSLSIPIVATLLIESYGWRAGFIGLGLIWGAIGLPLTFFLLRDGRGTGPGAKSDEPMVPQTTQLGLPLRQAILSRKFFGIVGAAFFFTFVAMSFVVSAIPILVWQGLDAKEAAGVAAMFGVSAIFGRLATGYLLDKFDARLVTSIAMAFPIVATVVLWSMPGSIPAATFAIVAMGVALGAEVDALAYLISRYFGIRNYAFLFALTTSATSAATAMAPVVSGAIYDATGGYGQLLTILIFPCLVSVLLIATLGRQPDFDAMRVGGGNADEELYPADARA
jgi:MFS family permease